MAAPYSHDDPRVRHGRAIHVSIFVADLYQMYPDHSFFSPISHSHMLAKYGHLEGAFDFWREFDEAMIGRSDEVWVFTVDGWEESKGVKAETEYAEFIGLPVRYTRTGVFDE